MLTYDDALNLNYYKKTTFTGWMNGMRFLIKREEPVIRKPPRILPRKMVSQSFMHGYGRGRIFLT